MSLRDDVNEHDVIAIPEVRPERSRNELVLVPISTATKKANTSTTKNEEKDKEDDQAKCDDYFDDNQNHRVV